MKSRLVFVVFALLLGLDAPARAEDTKSACIAAADKGQELRDKKKLLAAREQFVSCARDVCAAPIRKECSKWHDEVEASLPTVSIVALHGSDAVANVRVFVDGAVLLEKLEGSAVPIDPGVRKFRFELEGSKTIEQDVMVLEGEKLQKVSVTFPKSEAPKEEPKKDPPVDTKPKDAKPPVPEASKGIAVPSFDWSAGLLGSGGAVLKGGTLKGFLGLELSFGWRMSDLIELGVFGYGGGSGIELNGNVATAGSVETAGSYARGAFGLRARLHPLKEIVDPWVGFDLVGVGETWEFKGAGTTDKSFRYTAGAGALGIDLGLDYPLSESWAIGATFRTLAASGWKGSRVSCGTNCDGDVPGGTASTRVFFDFGLRVTLVVPYGRK